MKPIYLDYAAATPLDKTVAAAMSKAAADFYNPSAIYLSAQASRRQIEASRKSVAKILGAKPSEIYFTSGATESNNLAIGGVLRAHPSTTVAVSAIEHAAALKVATRQPGSRLIKVDLNGLVQPAELRASITVKTVLVSIGYANNELGTIQSFRRLKPVIDQIKQRRAKAGNTCPLYLHSDASQAANYLDLSVNRLGVDLLTLSAGKIYGPKQAGCLYAKHGVKLQPLFYGGGQEGGLRSGTESLTLIIGFSTALTIASAMREQEAARLSGLKREFIDQLGRLAPTTRVLPIKRQLPNIVTLITPYEDGERLVMELDEAGLMTATGAACSASNHVPSHVLEAIGLSRREANGSLRLSFGRPTRLSQLKRAASIIAATLG
ncbi:MAG TPA: cysteine desulfurase family protein [Candidatus Saccharimonadales bacterium]